MVAYRCNYPAKPEIKGAKEVITGTCRHALQGTYPVCSKRPPALGRPPRQYRVHPLKRGASTPVLAAMDHGVASEVDVDPSRRASIRYR